MPPGATAASRAAIPLNLPGLGHPRLRAPRELREAPTIQAMDQLVDSPPLPLDLDLAWRNSFARLGPAFYTELPATLPSPYLVGLNRCTGRRANWTNRSAPEGGVEAFTGNRRSTGSRPLASVYSGHQFGVWAGQLGDGRAILWARIENPGRHRRSCSSRAAGPRPTRAWATAAPCCAPASANTSAPKRCRGWASHHPRAVRHRLAAPVQREDRRPRHRHAGVPQLRAFRAFRAFLGTRPARRAAPAGRLCDRHGIYPECRGASGSPAIRTPRCWSRSASAPRR